MTRHMTRHSPPNRHVTPPGQRAAKWIHLATWRVGPTISGHGTPWVHTHRQQAAQLIETIINIPRLRDALASAPCPHNVFAIRHKIFHLHAGASAPCPLTAKLFRPTKYYDMTRIATRDADTPFARARGAARRRRFALHIDTPDSTYTIRLTRSASASARALLATQHHTWHIQL